MAQKNGVYSSVPASSSASIEDDDEVTLELSNMTAASPTASNRYDDEDTLATKRDTYDSNNNGWCSPSTKATLTFVLVLISLLLNLIALSRLSSLSSGGKGGNSNLKSDGFCTSRDFQMNALRLVSAHPFRSLLTDTRGVSIFNATGVVAANDGAIYVSFSDVDELLYLPWQYTPLGIQNEFLTSEDRINGEDGFDALILVQNADIANEVQDVSMYTLRWPSNKVTENSNRTRRNDYINMQYVVKTESSNKDKKGGMIASVNEGCSFQILEMQDQPVLSSINIARFNGFEHFWAICKYPNCEREGKGVPGPLVILPVVDKNHQGVHEDNGGIITGNHTCLNYVKETDPMIVKGANFDDFSYSAWIKSRKPGEFDTQYTLAVGSDDGELWVGTVDAEVHNPENGVVYHLPREDADCDPMFCNIQSMSFINEDLIVMVNGPAKPTDPPSCFQYEQSIMKFLIPQ